MPKKNRNELFFIKPNSIKFKRLKKNGGQLSYRKVRGTSKKVYEANITLFNAFQKTDYDKKGKYLGISSNDLIKSNKNGKLNGLIKPIVNACPSK